MDSVEIMKLSETVASAGVGKYIYEAIQYQSTEMKLRKQREVPKF